MVGQSVLKNIVESWNISEIPEYRGFRCALCQKYLTRGAWHHWLHEDGYLTPVHFCDTCEKATDGVLAEEAAMNAVDRNSSGMKFSESAERMLEEMSARWNVRAPAVFKEFTCDRCGKPLEGAKGYHLWRNKKGVLTEYHLHRDCAKGIF